MDKLIQFLNGLRVPEQVAFAARCGTTAGYLRKAASKRHKLGDGLCINIERESRGKVRCEDLRDDVDWAYLRGTTPGGKVPSQSAEAPTVPADRAAATTAAAGV